MFRDQASEVVGFDSTWTKRGLSNQTAFTQTSEVLTDEAEVQTCGRASVAIQTEAPPKRGYSLMVDNSLELENFLKRVEPTVCAQLKRNLESHAYDGYEVCSEETTSTVSCLHTLTEASLKFEFQCTALAWSCTGSVLAASFGLHDHQNWCSHKSMLCTWNVDRSRLNSKKADVTIEVPNCLMCVAFHPEQPGIIAGGTFSGELRIWNIGAEGDPLVAASQFNNLAHQEPISKVCWVPYEEDQKQRHLLLSLGNDGKVLLWKWVAAELHLVNGFRLLTESVPRSLRVSKAKGDDPMGGTCLSFSHEDSNLFVVGTEGGGLFKCSLHTSASTLVDANTVEANLKSPVNFSFRPRHGPMYCVGCSPFHRNLFLACGTDAAVGLYSMLDASPLLSVEPGQGYLFAVSWSTSRPLVFAVGTADGQVLLYDLKVSHLKPAVKLDASPDQRAVYSVEYNPKRPQLLASGDASGVVKVWRLNTQLSVQAPGSDEREQLNKIAMETLATAAL